MITLPEAIGALKDLWGIPQVAPDSFGRYEFIFEDGLAFQIQPQGSDEVIVFAPIKSYPLGEMPSEADLIKLLQYAGARLRFDCGKLSWDRQGAQLIWCIKLRWSDMMRSEWLEIIESFLNSLEFWVKVSENDERGRAPAAPFVIMP